MWQQKTLSMATHMHYVVDTKKEKVQNFKKVLNSWFC